MGLISEPRKAVELLKQEPDQHKEFIYCIQGMLRLAYKVKDGYEVIFSRIVIIMSVFTLSLMICEQNSTRLVIQEQNLQRWVAQDQIEGRGIIVVLEMWYIWNVSKKARERAFYETLLSILQEKEPEAENTGEY